MGITKNSWNRISGAVRKIENLPVDTIRPPTVIQSGFVPFIAKLTSTYSSGYAWEYVGADNTLTSRPTWGSSTEMGRAYHVKGCTTLFAGFFVHMYSFELFEVLASQTCIDGTLTSGCSAGGSCTFGSYTLYNTWPDNIASGSKFVAHLRADKFIITDANCP